MEIRDIRSYIVEKNPVKKDTKFKNTVTSTKTEKAVTTIKRKSVNERHNC